MARQQVPETRPTEWLTATQMSERLGLSSERVRQLRKDGKFPEPQGSHHNRPVWQWDKVRQWGEKTGRLANGNPTKLGPEARPS